MAEFSDSADNYRGEIWGGLLAQLILWCASSKPYCFQGQQCNCDNNGVVLHGNTPASPLSACQVQSDLLCIFKATITQHSVSITYKYAASHRDRHTPRHLLPLRQRLNCDADTLAKDALQEAVRSHQGFQGRLLFDSICLSMNDTWVCPHHPRNFPF